MASASKVVAASVIHGCWSSLVHGLRPACCQSIAWTRYRGVNTFAYCIKGQSFGPGSASIPVPPPTGFYGAQVCPRQAEHGALRASILMVINLVRRRRRRRLRTQCTVSMARLPRRRDTLSPLLRVGDALTGTNEDSLASGCKARHGRFIHRRVVLVPICKSSSCL